MRIKILTLALLLMIANQTTSLAPKDIPCKLTNENTEITGEIEDEIENEENEQGDEVTVLPDFFEVYFEEFVLGFDDRGPLSLSGWYGCFISHFGV